MATIQARIEGLEKLKGYEQADRILREQLKKAMYQGTSVVVADTKAEWPVGVSGQARNSIASEVKEAGSAIVGTVGSSIVSPFPYPATTEYGRKPGKMPPPAALYRWVELVMDIHGEEIAEVAFRVARKIGRRGIKGKHILKKAIESNKDKILGFFEKALDGLERMLERK